MHIVCISIVIVNHERTAKCVIRYVSKVLVWSGLVRDSSAKSPRTSFELPPSSTSISLIEYDYMQPNTIHTAMDPPTTATSSASATASSYLSTFLNRTLHLHTTDGRMFAGQMKCTDPERNIILSMTHEYRQPSAADIKLAAERHEKAGKSGNVKVDMKKRFVGLVVVPGKYITKIEVEG